MMRRRDRRRLTTAAGAVLGAAALLVASPGTPEAASADCGENAGNVCWKNEACATFLFYKHCTTEFKYFPREPQSGGGGSSASPDNQGIVDTGECVWGRDYLGSEPRGC